VTAALGPIAMWVVIGLLVAGGAYFVYRKLVSGAVAKDDLKEVEKVIQRQEKFDEKMAEPVPTGDDAIDRLP